MSVKHNYNDMVRRCEETSEITGSFFDEFLVPYAIEREKLDAEFLGALSRHRDIVRNMPEGWVGFSITQYAGLKLFGRNGLAAKYLNHSALKKRSAGEIEFLRFHSENPWRMSFFRVEPLPEALFFDLVDVFTDEVFTVYSPGIGSILASGKSPSMMLLLLGFNGLCWQTYGTLAYFNGFQPFDVFYLATLLNGSIRHYGEVPEFIESNPVHFMLLFCRGELPLVVGRGHTVVYCKTEVKNIDLDPGMFAGEAMVIKSGNIHKITLPETESFPHYGACHYHSKKRHLVITAMTEWGYGKMVELLSGKGLSVPGRPPLFVTMGMMTLLKNDFKMNIDCTSPYDKTFAAAAPTKAEKKSLAKINAAMDEIVKAFNAKQPVDPEDLARRHGVEVENVKEIIKSLKNTLDNIPGRG